MTRDRCACGLPLHYSREESREAVEALIAQLGEMQMVKVVGRGAWLVPRHYVALHGISGGEIEALAVRYGWDKIEP